MVTRQEIVDEARRWVGTRFEHQGRARGLGTDCGGLVGGVAVAAGALPATWWAEVFDPQFGGYGRQPNGTLQRICESFMTTIDASTVQPADVLLMRFVSEPQHVGIVVPYVHGGLAIVHAMLRERKVAEHRMDALWWGRVVAAYRMPGIN